ncbi:hypothetical protein GE09DRAFT_347324 [Coniochaeta sp. 2T2.1]|nr:hypothetical protein GE09DRAFT_347324 [Coniochaeta sp. 2T2.1]
MGAVLRFGMMLMASSLPALASPLLEERAACHRDNLLRCYDPTGTKPTDVASRSAATAFCSSYLSIPVVTVVISTITPVSTLTSTTTTTDSTKVVTSVSTSVSIAEITVIATVTASSSSAAKRDAAATVAAPACAGTTNVPASVSSACSCLSITRSTNKITVTAPTSTHVIVSSVMKYRSIYADILFSSQLSTTRPRPQRKPLQLQQALPRQQLPPSYRPLHAVSRELFAISTTLSSNAVTRPMVALGAISLLVTRLMDFASYNELVRVMHGTVRVPKYFTFRAISLDSKGSYIMCNLSAMLNWTVCSL